MSDRNTTRNKNRLIGIVLLYFAGIAAGVFLYCFPPDGQSERFSIFAESFISGRLDKQFAEILVNSFCEPFVMLSGSDAAYVTECGIPCIDNLGTEGKNKYL